jgi:hypothetical protein
MADLRAGQAHLIEMGLGEEPVAAGAARDRRQEALRFVEAHRVGVYPDGLCDIGRTEILGFHGSFWIAYAFPSLPKAGCF